MKNTIILNKNDLNLIFEYAIKSYKNYNKNGRSKTDIIYDIFIGKCGELAYERLNSRKVTKTDFELRTTNDGGYDFIYTDDLNNNLKIDVKTLKKSYYSKVHINSDFINADFYALMQINKSTKDCVKCTFVGYVDKQTLKKQLKTDVLNKEITYIESYFFTEKNLNNKTHKNEFLTDFHKIKELENKIEKNKKNIEKYNAEIIKIKNTCNHRDDKGDFFITKSFIDPGSGKHYYVCSLCDTAFDYFEYKKLLKND